MFLLNPIKTNPCINDARFLTTVPDTAASTGSPPGQLHEAVLEGSVDDVLRALGEGHDVNEATWFGLTPLHLAARRCAAVRRAHQDPAKVYAICAALIAAGANPRARDFRGDMPAAWAEGYLPPSLRAAMLELAEAGAWPEDDRPYNTLTPDEVIARGENLAFQLRRSAKRRAA